MRKENVILIVLTIVMILSYYVANSYLNKWAYLSIFVAWVSYAAYYTNRLIKEENNHE